ncbi:MAG TPA: DCC1-like thiol-disulfide oxidoreductase family protein [Steroidobacteraceae bacterium]|nr:DCC1-like thiol-disulfide oxidoreductase family protein [Steroidobacteraceae bacterium]
MRLVYDPQCPMCDAYCRTVRASGAPAAVELVSARSASPLMQEITRRGLDIDQGMVVEADGHLYYGAAAIAALAAQLGATGVFARLNRWLFGSRQRAALVYPALRAARNLLLKLLRCPKVNNLARPGNERF